MEVWVIRHGQTEGNLKKILQGHSDGKLTRNGIEQAQVTGKRLIDEEFEKAFVSDVGRTKETFNHLIALNNAKEATEVKYTPLLREKGAGVLQGQKLAQFAKNAKASGAPLREYKPQGGESWLDVRSRVEKFVEKLAGEGFRGEVDNLFEEPKMLSKVLLVSHGGWVMEMFNFINERSEGDQKNINNVIRNCSVNIFRMTCSKTGDVCSPENQCQGVDCLKFEVIKMNDIEHILEWKAEKEYNDELVKSKTKTFKKSGSKVGSSMRSNIKKTPSINLKK